MTRTVKNLGAAGIGLHQIPADVRLAAALTDLP
jgi:hypothetical protein